MTERRTCPRCGESALVNKDGSLRKHKRWFSGGMYQWSKWVPCVEKPS